MMINLCLALYIALYVSMYLTIINYGRLVRWNAIELIRDRYANPRYMLAALLLLTLCIALVIFILVVALANVRGLKALTLIPIIYALVLTLLHTIIAKSLKTSHSEFRIAILLAVLNCLMIAMIIAYKTIEISGELAFIDAYFLSIQLLSNAVVFKLIGRAKIRAIEAMCENDSYLPFEACKSILIKRY